MLRKVEHFDLRDGGGQRARPVVLSSLFYTVDNNFVNLSHPSQEATYIQVTDGLGPNIEQSLAGTYKAR